MNNASKGRSVTKRARLRCYFVALLEIDTLRGFQFRLVAARLFAFQIFALRFPDLKLGALRLRGRSLSAAGGSCAQTQLEAPSNGEGVHSPSPHEMCSSEFCRC